MNSPTTYEIYYDEESDFLEVFFGAPAPSIAEEIESDIFIRRDSVTHEIKSIGIFSFKKRPHILKTILKKINLRLPLTVNFD